ncbi:hypothetical protein, partial [Actinobacillus pleuropneumoniae]|uniref:hypothetical protein n=1 Tax=Actinobacillus pleuropneumoniae TaxID=715 RepID=UPI00227AE790
ELVKQKHVTNTSERPETRQESKKRKHATGTPEQPEKSRKSVWLARIRGRLEKLQESTSQLVEIEDEKSSRPEVEVEQAEGEER